MSFEERAISGLDLALFLARYSRAPVRVAFGGLHVPVTGVRYYAMGDEIVLDLGDLWVPREFISEDRESYTDEDAPKRDPGEP